MKIKKILSRQLWIDSFTIAISIIAAIETIFAIFDFGVEDVVCISHWWIKLIAIFCVFSFVWVLTAFVKAYRASKSISLNIRNIPITIKEGNIFDTKNWKVIPFNEFFDTQV